MINISQKATEYLCHILSKRKKKTDLRISIKDPGTQYAECKISYNNINEIKKTDIEIKYSSFSIYIDNKIYSYFKDAKIDLLNNNLGKQLMLMAPYAKEKMEYHNNQYNSIFFKLEKFIESNINIMLSNHGGKVILLDITNLGYVILKFLGGCNGCSMVNVTLKEGIEKKILNSFPTLKGVKDITNHNRGNHSFL